MSNKLEIKNLHVQVENKEILKGINLTVQSGEIVAIMGPNGNGKSTLLHTIMGNPKYEITKGEIIFNGKLLNELEVDERSKLGLFLGFQNPYEVPGVLNQDFLKAAVNARREKPINTFQFFSLVETNIKNMKMDMNLSKRYLNEGFSGGEKKRNEILQMKIINPAIALLDEIDSGLDVDAISDVAKVINDHISSNKDFAALIVSHYERIFSLIRPTKVYLLIAGKIVKEGKEDLMRKIDSEGYSWIQKELGISVNISDEYKGGK